MNSPDIPASTETELGQWLDPVPENHRVLAHAMARQAQEASRRLHAAQMANLPLSEESITEPMLVELSLAVPGLQVRTLTKKAEAKEGADWEFWIEGERQWFAFLVQAKKAKRSRIAQGVTYDVGYLSGKKRKAPQINLLYATSAARSMPAVYAFYNDPFLAVDYLRHQCQGQNGLPDGLDGITTLSVGTTRWLFQGGWEKPLQVQHAAGYAFPWSCLAACPAADTCLSTVLPNLPTDPENMGFAKNTAEDDPALSTARAVHHIEKAHWSGTFATQTAAKPLAWGVRDLAPDYVPRPGQDSEDLPPYPQDGYPAPDHIVAVWRQRD